MLLVSFQTLQGQNSHLNNLIETYKQQNPNAAQATPRRDRSTVNQSVQPIGPLGPVAPPGPQGLGLLKDPYASPDDLINRPLSDGAMLTATHTPPTHRGSALRETGPLGGDHRDPLDSTFGNSSERSEPSPFHEMLFDARLNDVFFLDSQNTWAVGDRGVIWHTPDGGRSWFLQETPISCILYSVSFLNANTGLAVGGFRYPFSSQGRGVVLSTQNGGRTWSMYETPELPVLHHVKILDSTRCLLAGEPSERCPSGLFSSSDAGRTWKPISAGKSEGWTSVDFYDEQNALGIGTQGALQRFQNKTATKAATNISTVDSSRFGSTRFKEIRTVSASNPPEDINGWMVGEGGLILSTTDQGKRWSVTPGKLPGNTSTLVDLNTIENRGRKLWVAGNPGTFIYQSDDLGKTWRASPTGVTATIRKIRFFDDRQGWAVGDLGTILKTDDGGITWHRLRTGAARLAVLGIFGRAEEIPHEAFVRLCAHQGYQGGVVMMFREQSGERDLGRENHESARIDRIHEALVRDGTGGAWELGPFPLEHDELQTSFERLVEQIQKDNDGKGLQRLRERLVLVLRQWKPDVILSHGTVGNTGTQNGSPKDPVRELVVREIMSAVRMADDPTAFPFQLTELGLAPWKVKKVHLVLDDGTLGDVNLATTEPSIRLGRSIDELAYFSRGLHDLQWNPVPALLGFSTPFDEAPPVGNRDFFAGIEIAPGSEARRALIGSYAEQWEEIQKRIQQQRHTLGIIQNTAKIAEETGRSKSDVRLASNALELTRKIDRDAAVRVLLEMGRKYDAEGDWPSACEAYELIANQYPDHPMTRNAFLWLIRYYSAEETAWRKHRDSQSSLATSSVDKRGNIIQTTSHGKPFNRHEADPRWEKAIAIGQYLERNQSDLAQDVRIRFALAAVQRQMGWGSEALKFFRLRADLKYDDVWGMRARAEYWLSVEDKSELPDEQRESPLPIMICSFTSTKPYLDGRFDKQYDQGTWFNSKLYGFTPEKPRKRLQEMMKDRSAASDDTAAGFHREEKLRSGSKKFGTQVMFMYDQEYLYLGFRCNRVAEFSYPPVAERPRSRDAAVEDQDRVEILLDVDRDYGTYYSLTIDSRGWIVDACWNDKTWNPGWYVARHEDRDNWYIEAAIPLESLTDRRPVPNTVWGVGLRRIIPGIGIECWNAENSFDLTEGLGLMLFE